MVKKVPRESSRKKNLFSLEHKLKFRKVSSVMWDC